MLHLDVAGDLTGGAYIAHIDRADVRAKASAPHIITGRNSGAVLGRSALRFRPVPMSIAAARVEACWRVRSPVRDGHAAFTSPEGTGRR